MVGGRGIEMTRGRLTDDRTSPGHGPHLGRGETLLCEPGRGAYRDASHKRREAEVSRETLYQYFPDRDALQAAYSQRQALEDLAAEAFSTIHPGDPLDRQLVEVVMAVLRAVRSDPVLAEQFGSDNVGATVAFAHRSEVVRGIQETFFVELSRDAQEAAATYDLPRGRRVLDNAGRRRTLRTSPAGKVRGAGVRGSRRLTWR